MTPQQGINTNVASTEEVVQAASPTEGTLRLQAEPVLDNRRVTWSEDTVDNEDLNKKKSNICCIFHPKEDGDCPPSHEHPDDPEAWNAYERQPKHNPKPPSDI